MDWSKRLARLLSAFWGLPYAGDLPVSDFCWAVYHGWRMPWQWQAFCRAPSVPQAWAVSHPTYQASDEAQGIMRGLFGEGGVERAVAVPGSGDGGSRLTAEMWRQLRLYMEVPSGVQRGVQPRDGDAVGLRCTRACGAEAGG